MKFINGSLKSNVSRTFIYIYNAFEQFSQCIKHSFMKSSIKVDFKHDGNGLQPIIAIKLIESDDPRDGLLKAFMQQLGTVSSWASLSFDHHVIDGNRDSTTYVTMKPVTPEQLPLLSKEIEDRLTMINQSPVNYNPLLDSER